MSAARSNDDVRMRGFAHRALVADALTWVDEQTQPVEQESVSTLAAARRVLAESVTSRVNVPAFTRAMMDGFALQAADTAGASAYNILQLDVVGQVLPGQPWDGEIRRGQAVRIMTGAPVPPGADAVLPVEQTEWTDHKVTLQGEVPPGRHVSQPGEDVAVGHEILPIGRRLRPQDIGVLCSVGVAKVAVRRKIRVRVVVTGNELLPPGSSPAAHQIVDSNSPMLRALIERDGGIVIDSQIVPDDPEQILAAMEADVDMVLVSGGSSVGQEDHAPRLLAKHGDLAIHGIAMRPSSPTGMGRLDHRMVFLLPGNPVSCLCAYDFFAGRAIRAAAGLPVDWPYRVQTLPLARKLVSVVGRVDYARVTVVDNQVTPLAISGASILSSTTRADGFVIVGHDAEGFPEQAEVDVYFYDEATMTKRRVQSQM